MHFFSTADGQLCGRHRRRVLRVTKARAGQSITRGDCRGCDTASQDACAVVPTYLHAASKMHCSIMSGIVGVYTCRQIILIWPITSARLSAPTICMVWARVHCLMGCGAMLFSCQRTPRSMQIGGLCLSCMFDRSIEDALTSVDEAPCKNPSLGKPWARQ